MDKLVSIEKKVIDWPFFRDLILATSSNALAHPTFITYLNPYTATLAYEEVYHYEEVDHYVLDGAIVSKFYNFFFNQNFRTLSFDFSHAADDVFSLLQEKQLKVAFIGASQADLDVFVNKIEDKYPNLDIALARNGYLNFDQDLAPLIEQLNTIKPNFILISAGAPFQEKVGLAIKSAVNFSPVITTCGAFMSQTANAKRESYYPKWIDKLGLRWLYRLKKEKHIRTRWLKYYPRFALVYPTLKVFKKISGIIKK